MNQRVTFLSVVSLVGLLGGCARDLEKELSAAGLESLRGEAEALWTRNSAQFSSPQGVEVPQAQWPETIRTLNPESVRAAPDAVTIAVSTRMWSAQMLIVPCPACPELPEGRGFRKIAPRLYELSSK
jgi:hypothetical protein